MRDEVENGPQSTRRTPGGPLSEPIRPGVADPVGGRFREELGHGQSSCVRRLGEYAVQGVRQFDGDRGHERMSAGADRYDFE